MLRLYKPITDDIFKLHQFLEHLVCSVWCGADDNSCESKLQDDFKKLLPYKVNKNKSLNDEVERIYEVFKGLSDDQKDTIQEAFKTNNKIEKLCNKEEIPIYLSAMHKVVKDDIKPLFKWCYENLLDKAEVAGEKLQYYKDLIDENGFDECPCCGLIDFESIDPDNDYREDYDHYLPKSKYPFASVNFENLVPLCHKCNSKRKESKDPIENDRSAFYPFKIGDHDIGITIEVDKDQDIEKLAKKDLRFIFTGDDDKIETWDWLFDINSRYNDKLRPKVKTLIREMKNRYRQSKKENQGKSFTDIIDQEIENYQIDRFSDWKFIKIPFLKELKKREDLMSVFED